MNVLFPAACLDMEKGVGILNWCGKGVVETDAALQVITFCLILAQFGLMEAHVVTVSRFTKKIK